MKVILSADDFGLDTGINGEIIRAFERGIISSASIMTTMPGFEEATRYAREHPEFSFGVHLCYVEGQAASGVQPTLTDMAGAFNLTRSQRLRAMLGRLSVEEIAEETRAQISKLQDSGVRVDYVDSHGHMHKLKPFREALRRVLPSLGICNVRSSQTIYLEPKRMNPTYILREHFRRAIEALFVTTDEFYMPTSAGDKIWAGKLLARMEPSNDHSIEVGIHPGLAGNHGAEETEAREFKKLALDAGHTAISWKDLCKTGQH